jgi:hypothetical protein
VTLDQDDLAAIARLVAELISSTAGLVDARTVADELQVDRDWVYTHARELGAIRLGDGEKPRLRFDLRRVRERVAQMGAGGSDVVVDAPPPRGSRRPREQSALPGVKLIQGRSSR